MANLTIDLLVALATAFALRRLSWAQDQRRREWLLAALSAVLVESWETRALVVGASLTAVAWLTLRVMARTRGAAQRRVMWAGAIVLLLALVVLRERLTWTLVGFSGNVGAPLALSFVVFRLVGVLLDAGALRLDVGARQLWFMSLFFPAYRAGPIATLRSLKPLPEPPPWTGPLTRILVGLLRKMVLADTLNEAVVKPWLGAGAAGLGPLQSLLLPFALGAWVYWDFAGYSDMAIGMAALLGYRVPENFERPYSSRNLVEFWRRWHMTLSEWIRVRVFMKLTGRRPSALRVYGAAIVSMVLCGAWHGSSAGFLFWGLWHGVGLAVVHALSDVESTSDRLRDLLATPGARAVATGITFLYVNVGWLPFFLPLRDAWKVAVQGGLALAGAAGVVALAVVLALAWALPRAVQGVVALWEQAPPFARGLGWAALVWVLVVYAAASNAPFVYFRF
jgi:D-alanyl-lipoteichoic acid acyltransferase DltB (MBOAT superfamily)